MEGYMIISIFGKSGSGKTYLSSKLHKDLPNSIHLDLDTLNQDLLQLDRVKDFAINLFETNDIIINGKLDKGAIYHLIKIDLDKYTIWTNYMASECIEFVKNYIHSTTFDYYIIDHMRAGIIDFADVKIECVADFDTRLQRLQKREYISSSTLQFRDEKYFDSSSNISFDGKNYNNIIEYIKGANK